MVPLPNAVAFAFAAVVLIVIPGPSVLFTIGRSLAYGRRGGLLSVLGNAIGTLPATVLTAVGLGRLIAESVALFIAVKIVGALYLVYLGVQAIRHRHGRTGLPSGAARVPSSGRQLWQGIVVGATNPKTLVFFVAVLPQFVSRDAGSVPVQLAVLGCLFAAIALCCDSVWALIAGTARGWFGRDPRRLSQMTAGGGVMMVGLGGVLVATGSNH
ncbi:LysE family translocator [Nakamurella flavida]|uniref:LysE family translocator n=1 Tax=Nakamurella flavida TaxID=363630 RepID=A0A938YNK3_9ACTN|nr:LysE family translocator [Nakamurella flavida]MBM9477836.1 LysE family translocator [Nakamurella flavida]MDP9779390.1 threonine/homoserine/homoserine lactone efflux protein [Nakamurella flavida]